MITSWLAGASIGAGRRGDNLLSLPPARRAVAAMPLASQFLVHEARGLLTRLARVKPLVLNESTVQAAAFLPPALLAMEQRSWHGR